MIVDTLQRARQVWAGLGAELDQSRRQRPTRLPGWTVNDVYAPLRHPRGPPRTRLDRSAELRGSRPLLTHIHRPGARTEQAVAVLRGTTAQRTAETPAAALVAEFSEVGERVIAELREADLIRRALLGGCAVVPARESLRIFALEAVVHCFDLAIALCRENPGPVAGAGPHPHEPARRESRPGHADRRGHRPKRRTDLPRDALDVLGVRLVSAETGALPSRSAAETAASASAPPSAAVPRRS